VTHPDRPRGHGAIDAWLALMVAIWAGNFSLVKATLARIPPIPFNALRLILSSALFLSFLAWQHSRRDRRPETTPYVAWPALEPSVPSRRDWLAMAGLGLVGHFAYQLCFIGGLSRTSAANSALILGCTPVAVALLSAAVGQERVRPAHWVGAALSLLGLYLVAGRGVRVSGESLAGDALLLVGVGCWAFYTVFSRPLLERHSPLVVTGYSMAVGTALFVPVALPGLAALDWRAVEAGTWVALATSAVLAINVAYLIWYAAVQRIGNTRTSMYSNVVPVAALAIAWFWLGERIDVAKVTGAAAILSGVVLSRLAAGDLRRRLPGPPAEE
jgi:drug/metabolite transporter (DMT)-like permease